MSLETVYQHFYRVPRHSAELLSDRGGPFGFDIHAALAIDWLIERYRCDAIIETGCNRGDTTQFLAECYPHLPVLTCDILPEYTDHVRRRLGPYPNVVVEQCDSPVLLERIRGMFERPLYYLDAHWYEQWPLTRELAAIDRGVIVVDDFDIGHPRYGFDSYDGVACGPKILEPFADRFPFYYVNNPGAPWPLPCLQVDRLAGRAYLLAGLEPDYLRFNRWFARRQNPAG